MTVFYIILAASPVLLLIAAAFFVVIVIGVRKGDKADLASPPGNRIDSMTRRVAGVSVRRDSQGSER